MINYIHYLLNRPEAGWDPVPAAHAKSYSAVEMAFEANWTEKAARIAEKLGGLKGRAVLDLGGGPGHNSLAFARLGADVVWYDVSKGYRDIARALFERENAHAEFVVGYLDDAATILGRKFDLVFNRACWNYAYDETRFARVVSKLVAPGGTAYIEAMTASPPTSLKAVLQQTLNKAGMKVGHPFPPSGRTEKQLARAGMKVTSVHYAPTRDEIFAINPTS